jgi:Pyridoxamine 5'-phosphate oxidase
LTREVRFAGCRRLFDGPNFAHLASLMPDGSPQSTPVWVSREGDRILVGTSEASLKAKFAHLPFTHKPSS